MEQPIYGDVLFIINFTMDFLTLFIVGKIMHMAIKPLRYGIAAGIGALYGVAAVFLCGNSIISMLINLAVSLLMCYVAFGTRLLPCTALFYCTGCILGGGMTAMYHLANRSFGTRTVFVDGSVQTLPGNIPLGWMAVMAAVTGIIAVAGGRIYGRSRSVSTARIYAELDGRSIEFEALADSGNLLCEPISGAPVIITGLETLSDLIGEDLKRVISGEIADADKLGFETMRKVRFIPIDDIHGNGVITGIMPSKITVSGVEVKACIALDRRNEKDGSSGYGGYAGIVPAVLCGHSQYRKSKCEEKAERLEKKC